MGWYSCVGFRARGHLGFRLLGNIISMMENQMDKNMQHEMELGLVLHGFEVDGPRWVKTQSVPRRPLFTSHAQRMSPDIVLYVRRANK